MAFANGLSRTFPGFGLSFYSGNNSIQGVPISSATAYYIPSVTPFTTAVPFLVGMTVGRMRIKIYNGGGTSPVLTKVQVIASDGTNSVVIFDDNLGATIAISATSWYERIFDFILDTAAGSTNGGAVGQLINGGAVQFKITPTMTGTSPTFSMDAEVLGSL
jgi:hypothetical protein